MSPSLPSSDLILYAEDDENDAFFLDRALQKIGSGARLFVARDGAVALDYLQGVGAFSDRARYPLPRLVLLDLHMPGFSGFDLLIAIRAAPATATLPVVVLTSSNVESDVRRAYANGANGYLVKPGNLDLIVVMAQAVRDYWLGHNVTPPAARAAQ